MHLCLGLGLAAAVLCVLTGCDNTKADARVGRRLDVAHLSCTPVVSCESERWPFAPFPSRLLDRELAQKQHFFRSNDGETAKLCASGLSHVTVPVVMDMKAVGTQLVAAF